MKKIVFVVQNYNVGGSERVTLTIMRTLNSELYEIHTIVISELGELGYLIPEEVKLHELRTPKTRNSIYNLVKTLRKIKPDVVFTSFHRISILLNISRFFLKNKFKLISRCPTMPQREINENKHNGWRLILTKLIYGKSDLIIAQSLEMKEELIKVYKNLDGNKIRVLHNPIDKKLLIESSHFSENPFDNKVINILSVGNINDLKGFDILLKSANQLVKSNPNFHFHIIGKDYGQKMSLLNYIKKNNLSNNVHFYDFIKNLTPYYKNCDLFVLSSRREGLPNAMLECQFFNKPVVATYCIPIIKRLVIDGKNGYVVDIDDYQKMSEKIKEAINLKNIINPLINVDINSFIEI